MQIHTLLIPRKAFLGVKYVLSIDITYFYFLNIVFFHIECNLKKNWDTISFIVDA